MVGVLRLSTLSMSRSLFLAGTSMESRSRVILCQVNILVQTFLSHSLLFLFRYLQTLYFKLYKLYLFQALKWGRRKSTVKENYLSESSSKVLSPCIRFLSTFFFVLIDFPSLRVPATDSTSLYKLNKLLADSRELTLINFVFRKL